jgi:FkbM family methyltransferase
MLKSLSVGSRVLVYGTGGFAKSVANNSIKIGYEVVGFVDHVNVHLPVILNNLEYEVFDSQDLPDSGSYDAILLGIGNGYADLNNIYQELLRHTTKDSIYSPVEFSYLCGRNGINLDCYWMQSESDFYGEYSREIIETLKIFEDDQSRSLFLQILKYREFGELSDLPHPDLNSEQYLPTGLSTPPKNLRMLDLGACKGENLEFFLNRGHIVDFASFFEPDYSNFVFLAEKLRALKIQNSLVLPLAAWDETKLLSFEASSDTSSHLVEAGDSFIQAVNLSDFLATTSVNYIKMDIEGAEYEALLGLEPIIKRDCPHLAISVYHKPDDMWKIGLWLHSKFGNEYTFHLRVYNFQTFDTLLYAIPRN